MTGSDGENTRARLLLACQQLADSGLSHGSTGNLSVRSGDGMLITATGSELATLEPQQLVQADLDGSLGPSQLRPSSEWLMHATIYRHRPDIGAVVHCHSRYATILACARRSIPALHYMIAVTGSDEIPCAPYATFGSILLAQQALRALEGRRACLLANHGQIAIGGDVAEALRVAAEVEELAATYWGCLAIGDVELLSRGQMDDVLHAFAGYGQQAQGDGQS